MFTRRACPSGSSHTRSVVVAPAVQEARLEAAACGRRWVCPRCGSGLVVCDRCDRGHVYCGPECARAARRASHRAAQRRHRQSPEGRADHRDRERARRQRRREARLAAVHAGDRVADHSSDSGLAVGTVAPRAAAPVIGAEGPQSTPSGRAREIHGGSTAPPRPFERRLAGPRCVVCHCRVRFLQVHFAPGGWRRPPQHLPPLHA